MDSSLLKNPIIWGIIAATLTYLYLLWDAKNMSKKNPELKNQSVNLYTVGLIGIVTWYLTSCYFDSYLQDVNIQDKITNNSPSNGFALVKDGVSGNPEINAANAPELIKNMDLQNLGANNSIGSTSFHLVGKNKIRLPPPDVFIDMANF